MKTEKHKGHVRVFCFSLHTIFFRDLSFLFIPETTVGFIQPHAGIRTAAFHPMHGKKAAVVLFPKDIMMFLLRTSFPEFDCEYQSSDQHRHRHKQQKRFIAFRLSRLIEGESRRVGTADIGRSLPARIVRRLPVEIAGELSV